MTDRSKLPGDGWATCSSCTMTRRVAAGVMVPHNRWDGEARAMTHCPGSLYAPVADAKAVPDVPFSEVR